MSAPYNLAADDAAVLPHILSALEAKPTGPGRYSFRCPLPNHGRGNGDRNPSASIGLAEDGGIAVNCFGGCNPKELWAAAVLPHLPRRPDTAAAEQHLIAEPQLIAVYPAPRDDSGRPAVKVYSQTVRWAGLRLSRLQRQGRQKWQGRQAYLAKPPPDTAATAIRYCFGGMMMGKNRWWWLRGKRPPPPLPPPAALPPVISAAITWPAKPIIPL